MDRSGGARYNYPDNNGLNEYQATYAEKEIRGPENDLVPGWDGRIQSKPLS